jgi:uncharacterized protein YndB with AHSA1/START domain
MRARLMALAFAAGLAAAPASAAVIDAQPGGFQVRSVLQVAAPPDKVWAAYSQIGRWWSSSHTFSRDASHLSLDPKAGGCLCESLPGGGSVWFMTVIYAQPGQELRLKGALGPLQPMGVEGVLVWSVKPAGAGSELTWTYTLGGYMPGGLAAIAGPVDQVLAEQQNRLKAFVETGAAPP